MSRLRIWKTLTPYEIHLKTNNLNYYTQIFLNLKYLFYSFIKFE